MDYFSTGEVAKKLNLSLRTLRYYDEIGLVNPALKDDYGKRLYSPQNLLLLQKIQLLKSASMTLEDIQKMITQTTVFKTLTIHKEQLEQEMDELKQSLDYTHTLFNILKLEGELKWNQLLPLVAEDQNVKDLRRKKALEVLFSDDEKEILRKRLPKMETDHEQLTKWMNLIKRIEICLEEGKGPETRDGQLIAEDTLILSNELFKGNTALAEKFFEARKSKTASADLNFYPVQDDVMAFMEEAVLYYEQQVI
ncbi:MerR family transcriptional regulator [Jeotgalibacillus campisalis]|uniref:HTH merR-type domain-containing protein n=1 Tax=Jeotgalibacillus campisalis TaxID=220754 RepID=A0A0C2W343_9BACL|nr:MerR family transcriptional regulator [Jeotgalibacillus campisalis]KIL51036.1 hypothetical protein KR50_09170 [Jeotgalibacillus campisalis]